MTTQWNKFVNHMPLPVLVVNRQLQICASNEAAQDIFQTSLSRVIGHFIPDIFIENTALITALNLVLQHNVPIREKQCQLNVHNIVRPIYADILIFPFDDSDGSYLGVCIQPKGVAEQIDLQFVAQKSADHLSGIAGVLAHEIKNPLAGIRGAAQLLSHSVPEDERALTQLITEETDRIARLIASMEQFGANAPLHKKPFNIHEVLGHVKQLAQAGFGRQVEFIEEYDPSLPDILGCRDSMIQLILNLVKNAVEATEMVDQRQIYLKTAYKPGLWVIHEDNNSRVHVPLEVMVQDNGAGFDNSMKHRIFEPFMTNKPTGRGLGLALSAKIVRDHGGVIDVESQKGCTQFRILLPLIKEG